MATIVSCGRTVNVLAIIAGERFTGRLFEPESTRDQLIQIEGELQSMSPLAVGLESLAKDLLLNAGLAIDADGRFLVPIIGRSIEPLELHRVAMRIVACGELRILGFRAAGPGPGRCSNH